MDVNQREFWEIEKKYDVIQIHWPEIFFYLQKSVLPSKQFAERLSDTLRQWKRRGTKIVFTRHDATVHYATSPEARTHLYDIIESEADAIVHLGNFSKDQMLDHNPKNNRLHVVIPHHVYDTIYPCPVPQDEARKALGIDEKQKVILVFGAFRDEEENLLVKNAFERLNDPNKYLVAPSWYHDGDQVYENKNIAIEGACRLGRGRVDRCMTPYCFGVANVVFIQRLRNLNSGNLQLGFLFNKTVIAPAIGNMTELIDNENNFSFDPYDPASVVSALQKGLARSQYPQANGDHARKHWNTRKICDSYRQLYQQLTG
jgi:glycosyltransferase involved in cell wall biosynthesis